MNLFRVRRNLRRGTYVAAALGLGYLGLRFEFHTLPAQGCSPLVRFGPGTSLLLDRRPPSYGVDDAFLFRAPDGLLYLARAERVRPADGAIWALVDNSECAGSGSERFGWILPEQCVARVMMPWPW